MLFMTGLYFISEYAKTHKAELEAMPLDKEVEAYEAKARHQAALHAHVTEWKKVPLWLKAVLVLGTASMTLASYAIAFYPDLCFKQYDLTNSIKCDLDGSVFNLILPEGQYAMLLLLVSSICLQVYSCWAGRQRSAMSEEAKAQVIRRTDKSWGIGQRRLSASPFLRDEAPHASWREGSKTAEQSSSALTAHSSAEAGMNGVVV
jgi:hypothetical protein